MRQKTVFTSEKFYFDFGNFHEEIYFHPIGDIHFEAVLCHQDKFIDWCKARRKDIKEGKKLVFLGMGDYNDCLSISDQMITDHPKKKNTLEDAMNEYARNKADILIKHLDFMNSGNTIGLIEGNHYMRLKTGITTTQYMCEKLGVPYIGIASIIKLILKSERLKESFVVTIFAHHGRGGGRRVSASINSVEDMQKIFPSADIYIMGDDHKKYSVSSSRLEQSDMDDIYGKPIIRAKKTLYCRSGGYLRGYVSGKESYVAGKALPPLDLGSLMIKMIPTRKTFRENGKTITDRYVDLYGVA